MMARHHEGVHPTGGSLRVFRRFSWLEAGSVKTALSRPTHQQVTRTVKRYQKSQKEKEKMKWQKQ
jgi:hypothetical protein